MNKLLRQLILGISLMAGTFLLTGTSVAYDKHEGPDPLLAIEKKPEDLSGSSQSLAFDNDVLVPGSRDQDYTYGISLGLAGPAAENQWSSLHQPLDWFDRRIGLTDRIGLAIETNKIEYGLFGFTPEDITQLSPTLDDRPYASLVYISSSKERYDPSQQVSWQSTLTLGIMGLSIVGDIQSSVHSAQGSNKAQGWGNQISAGGEPTARYNLSRQSLVYKSDSGFELKSTTLGSVGYITEASWSLSLRAGKIHTPWVSFNPELVSYAEKSNPTSSGKVSEQYVWAGISFKARAYNAFLEGQFKDSAVTYGSKDINRGIVEAWLGYTVALEEGYSFTYSIRGHTSELKNGNGNRNVVWGGVLLTKTFS